MTQQTCPECGRVVKPRKKSGGKPKKYCSKRCRSLARTATCDKPPCPICGTSLVRRARKYCGRLCALLAKREKSLEYTRRYVASNLQKRREAARKCSRSWRAVNTEKSRERARESLQCRTTARFWAQLASDQQKLKDFDKERQP